MRLQKAVVAAIVVVIAVGLVGCREEVPPEQRLAQIRYNHVIFPVAANTMYDAEDNPTLLVDLQVANQGGVPLSKLTVLVKVLGPDGVVKNSERVTLDLEGVQPGIAGHSAGHSWRGAPPFVELPVSGYRSIGVQ